MRLLVTGRDGQLGWELARALAPLGDVIALGRAELDLFWPDAIRETVRALSPDWIINAAAYTAVDRAESEAHIAQAINGAAPGILAEEALRLSAGFIHYSTDYVFNGKQSWPYVETDPARPNSVYGRSKLEGEQRILTSGASAWIFRTSWVYEQRGKNFLLTMLRLANERPLLKVVADQTGAPTRARMIATATALAIARRQSRRQTPGPGIYHLTADGTTTWHGFASRIIEWGAARGLCKLVPIEAINTAEYPTPAQRPAYSLLSSARFARDFDLRLPDWEQSLEQCMDELVR